MFTILGESHSFIIEKKIQDVDVQSFKSLIFHSGLRARGAQSTNCAWYFHGDNNFLTATFFIMTAVP